MNLTELREKFHVSMTEDKEHYWIGSKREFIDEFYPDYHGTSNCPFLGYIFKNRSNIFWKPVYFDGRQSDSYKIGSVDELKSYMKIMIDNCASYHVFTDCCDPLFNRAFRCECALHFYLTNYLGINIEEIIADNVYKLDFFDIVYRHHIDIDALNLSIFFSDNMYTKRVFINPYDLLIYVRELIQVYSISNVAKYLQIVCKTGDVSFNSNQNLFYNDIVEQFDINTFSVEKVGTLKEQIIKELEDKLKQLKDE